MTLFDVTYDILKGCAFLALLIIAMGAPLWFAFPVLVAANVYLYLKNH